MEAAVKTVIVAVLKKSVVRSVIAQSNSSKQVTFS